MVAPELCEDIARMIAEAPERFRSASADPEEDLRIWTVQALWRLQAAAALAAPVTEDDVARVEEALIALALGDGDHRCDALA